MRRLSSCQYISFALAVVMIVSARRCGCCSACCTEALRIFRRSCTKHAEHCQHTLVVTRLCQLQELPWDTLLSIAKCRMVQVPLYADCCSTGQTPAALLSTQLRRQANRQRMVTSNENNAHLGDCLLGSHVVGLRLARRRLYMCKWIGMLGGPKPGSQPRLNCTPRPVGLLQEERHVSTHVKKDPSQHFSHNFIPAMMHHKNASHPLLTLRHLGILANVQRGNLDSFAVITSHVT